MIKFQGRSSLKQYMPLKPTKRGIKVWVAADSTNGYFSRFEIYTGKNGNNTEHGLGARVVKTLTSDLKGQFHHVYFDNPFTSLSLLEDLEKDQIYACGTARKDRKGFPDELKLKNRCAVIMSVCVYTSVCVHACACCDTCMCMLCDSKSMCTYMYVCMCRGMRTCMCTHACVVCACTCTRT